jgi:hypothetical protein
MNRLGASPDNTCILVLYWPRNIQWHCCMDLFVNGHQGYFCRCYTRKFQLVPEFLPYLMKGNSWRIYGQIKFKDGLVLPRSNTLSTFLLTVMFVHEMVEIQLFLRQLVRELIIKLHIQYLHRVCTRHVFCVNRQYCIQTHRNKKNESFEILSSRNWMPYLDTECTFIPKNKNMFITFLVQYGVGSYTRTKPLIKEAFTNIKTWKLQF